MENLPQVQTSPKPESTKGKSITASELTALEQYLSLVRPIESEFDEPSPLIAAIRPRINQNPFLSPIPEEVEMGAQGSAGTTFAQDPASPQMTEAERKREVKRQKDREYYQQNRAKILTQKKASKAEKKN